MKKVLISIAVVLSLFSCSRSVIKGNTLKENIIFIPSLHQLHEHNKNYSYEALKKFIRSSNPDIIAVEIRPEDIGYDTLYLKQNYPLEMRQMKYWFPETTVVGIDWLGDQLAGKPIPDGYWKDVSPIKKLQRELAKDTLFQARLKPCYFRSQEREVLLKTLALQDLIESADKEIVINEYNCFEEMVKNSKYQALSDFYKERNEKILKNINAIIKKNPNKRILIVTGDDHYIALKNRVLSQ
jgi:hypothetical protein